MGLNYISRCVERYSLDECRLDMERAVKVMENCYKSGGKILTCGNGGSAADSEHIVGELMKSFIILRQLSDDFKERLKACGADEELCHSLQPPIPAISLSSGVALPTAFANDVAPQNVFAQQMLGLGMSGDVMIAISTSGKSVNVLNAMIVAKAKGVKTIALTKHGNTKMSEIADVTIGVPADHTPDIQELHLPVYHALCAELERRIFESDF